MWRVGTLENPDPDNLPEGTFTATVPVRDKQAGETISYILTDIAERTRYVVAVIAVDPWGNRSSTSAISFGTPANTPPTLVREGDTAVSIPYNETRTVAFLVSDPDSHGFTYELQDPSGAVTPRKDDERLYLDIRNYKRVPGSYTAVSPAPTVSGPPTRPHSISRSSPTCRPFRTTPSRPYTSVRCRRPQSSRPPQVSTTKSRRR